MINIKKTYALQYKIVCSICGKEKYINKSIFKKFGWKNHPCPISIPTVDPIVDCYDIENKIVVIGGEELKYDLFLSNKPEVVEVAEVAPKTFEIDFKEEIKPGPRKSKKLNK